MKPERMKLVVCNDNLGINYASSFTEADVELRLRIIQNRRRLIAAWYFTDSMQLSSKKLISDS
jgi:hypothetical protein